LPAKFSQEGFTEDFHSKTVACRRDTVMPSELRTDLFSYQPVVRT